MIPRDFITEWRVQAPWVEDFQVEQDLVISRALVELFRHPALARALAFRGGTALHKLHFRPAARYSEDIDLVQVEAGPIGPIFDAVRAVLDPWLGEPRSKQSEGRATMTYRFISEGLPAVPLKLKVEINTREHFCVYGHETTPLSVDSRWFSGGAEIRTYALDELLGTKLRALYQRKKGRDVFDLALALTQGRAQPRRIIECFRRYMRAEGAAVTGRTFADNLASKRRDRSFTADIAPLLAPGHAWDFERGLTLVTDALIARLDEDFE